MDDTAGTRHASMETTKFTVTVPRTYTFETGWGVWFLAVYDYDEETDTEGGITDVDGGVVRIEASAVQIIGGSPCVLIGRRMYVPVENFERIEDETNGDTHDLRSRFFESEDDAREHLDYTLKRWANPQPWESFVRL